MVLEKLTNIIGKMLTASNTFSAAIWLHLTDKECEIRKQDSIYLQMKASEYISSSHLSRETSKKKKYLQAPITPLRAIYLRKYNIYQAVF